MMIFYTLIVRDRAGRIIDTIECDAGGAPTTRQLNFALAVRAKAGASHIEVVKSTERRAPWTATQ